MRLVETLRRMACSHDWEWRPVGDEARTDDGLPSGPVEQYCPNCGETVTVEDVRREGSRS